VCLSVPLCPNLPVLLTCTPMPFISPAGPVFPQVPPPPPQSCLFPSLASEEHVRTRVPSEVRGEKRGSQALLGRGGDRSSWRCGGVSVEVSPHTAGVGGL
jgi:hypothetical protein